MERQRVRLSPYMLAGFLVTASISPALAVEADAAGERLKKLLEMQEVELSYDGARLDGDDVTLENVTMASTVAKDGLKLGDLVLEDVVEEPDGSYRVGTLAVDSYEHQLDGVTLSIIDLTISGLVLPEDPASDPFGGAMRYHRADVARMEFDGDEGPVASFGNIYSEMSVAEDNTLEMVGGAESFSFNLAAGMDDNNTATALNEMGYSEISGSAILEGSWRPSDGRMILSRYESTIDDAGSLILSMDFSGYTPAFIKTLQETTKNLAKQGDSANSSMQGMAMLGLMQQLTFHGASIRFNDNSLTQKVLERISQKENKSQAEIVDEAKTGISQQLSPVLGSDFTNTVREAVGTYLESPENIEVSAQPANPVPFTMLMGAAMGAPEMLVQQLGLTVKANQ